MVLDKVIRFFDRQPREGPLGENAHFPQAFVAGQLMISRAADGLQKARIWSFDRFMA